MRFRFCCMKKIFHNQQTECKNFLNFHDIAENYDQLGKNNRYASHIQKTTIMYETFSLAMISSILPSLMEIVHLANAFVMNECGCVGGIRKQLLIHNVYGFKKHELLLKMGRECANSILRRKMNSQSNNISE